MDWAEPKVSDTVAAGGAGPFEPAFEGDLFRTVTGGLRGVYRLEVGTRPSATQLQAALGRRVERDRQRLRRHAGDTRLTEWFGGWTPEGRGIFEAEIELASRPGRWRHAGRVRVHVQVARRPERWVALPVAS
jgi:hypothetical protein